MKGLNKVLLIGNLGRDPEIRHTPSGTPVANFTLATSDSFTDRSGNRQDRTEWHRIVVWNKLAEICSQYLRKGSQVFLEGRLQTRQWEDQQGQRRSTTEVVANNMVMLGGRGDGGAGRYQEAGSQSGEYQAAGPQAGEYQAAGTQAGEQESASAAATVAEQPAGSGFTPDSSLDPATEDDDLPF